MPLRRSYSDSELLRGINVAPDDTPCRREYCKKREEFLKRKKLTLRTIHTVRDLQWTLLKKLNRSRIRLEQRDPENVVQSSVAETPTAIIHPERAEADSVNDPTTGSLSQTPTAPYIPDFFGPGPSNWRPPKHQHTRERETDHVRRSNKTPASTGNTSTRSRDSTASTSFANQPAQPATDARGTAATALPKKSKKKGSSPNNCWVGPDGIMRMEVKFLKERILVTGSAPGIPIGPLDAVRAAYGSLNKNNDNNNDNNTKKNKKKDAA